MKKIVASTFFLLIIACFTLRAQELGMGVHFNWIYIGENIGLYGDCKIDRHKFDLGVSYQLNRQKNQSYGILFYKRGYGRNFGEKIGINFSYNYCIYSYKDRLNFYVGYRIAYTHTGFRTMVTPNNEVFFSPAHIVDHYFIPTIEYRGKNNTKIWIKGGVGANTYYDMDKSLVLHLKKKSLFGQMQDFALMFSIGAGYIFK